MVTKIKTPVWPRFEQDEQDAVQKVLQSGRTNYWYGDEGKLFEKEFAHWCGVEHALTVANGTLALELALKAIGVQSGDEVLVTPRSFLASAAAVAAVGAIPVFVDVDGESGNMSPESIEHAVTQNTSAILVVHLGGWPAKMNDICAIANKYSLKVIEDCAQAHGASIDNQRVGTFGDIAAFSFCQDKIISTGGEGGMIVTNNFKAFEVAWSLRDHGRNREQTLSDDHPFGFRWLQERIGTNARMSEMQSAIGRCQLTKVEDWVGQRTANANEIQNAFVDSEHIYFPTPPEGYTHAFYRLTGFVKDEERRDSIVDNLQRAGVHASVGPCPEIYKEKAFQHEGLVPQNELPVAGGLGKKSLVLSVHPDVQMVLDEVIHALKHFLQNP